MNPLGVITGEKELLVGISIDTESIIYLCLGVLIAVSLGVVLGEMVKKAI